MNSPRGRSLFSENYSKKYNLFGGEKSKAFPQMPAVNN